MSLAEQEKRLQGDEYNANTKAFRKERMAAKVKCHEFNALRPTDISAKGRMLFELLGSMKSAWIEPPFFCDYGYNISVGENFYANHGVVILDAAPVTIGDDVLLGPSVNIATVSHPLEAESRKKGLQVARAVSIGNNVWVGMGAQILPGVTISDNSVVAAGAVVTKDVPAGVLVAGVPATVIKTL